MIDSGTPYAGTQSPLAALESIEAVSELADLFQLMADASRLRIILTVLEEKKSVSDIAASLALSQPLVSHHALVRGGVDPHRTVPVAGRERRDLRDLGGAEQGGERLLRAVRA